MTPERWAKVRELVERAISLPVDERGAFVRTQTEDADLVAEVDKLLGYDRQASALFSIEDWQQRVERTAPDANLSGSVLGNYRLLDELGRGGMGTVYLAERADGVYQQRVALKVLQENIFTPALAERFRQERQILARLQHPGIARLLDGGVMPDRRPYLVLEYVDGVPIDEYCDRQSLDVKARLHLFLRVAEVVQSAHQQLVLHLDLKPANILVTAEGEPRLLDFGIARILSEGEGLEGQTEATLRLLTPRYASPEQATGKPLDVASDVFSLSTLLYRLLTGRLPYPIDDAAPLEAARMICEMPPKPPSEVASAETAPLLRGDMDTILLQGLRKEPERRYPTVAALADDVRRHLASEPVVAHADSFGYRASKFLRRNQGSVTAAALVAVILLVSAIAVVRSAIVARHERAIAEMQKAVAERRLKDVRALAHSYIFDLDPQLGQIPGTVGVRNFILKNSLIYLQAMSQESEGDDDLSREVAAGYDRMGRAQAQYQGASLGDTAEASVSMGKGIEIQRRLLEKDPGDLKQRALLFQQMRHQLDIPQMDGDIVLFDKMTHDLWDIAQPLLMAGPKYRVFLNIDGIAWDLATAQAGNGPLWNFADPAAALPWLDNENEILERYRAAYPQEAQNPALLGGYEREDITRADALVQLGRATEARHLYEDALHQTTLTHNEVVEDEARKIIQGDYAAYLLLMHDVGGAARRAPASAAEDPAVKEADLTADDADSLALLARIDLENGQTKRGERRMTRSLEIFERLHKANPQDASTSSEMAWDTYLLAEEKKLEPAVRRGLYGRASEIAEIYWGTHQPVLSAELLAAKCDLGLAELAHDAQKSGEQRTLAAASIAKLEKVLAAHPMQPEASRVMALAKALVSG